MAGCSFGFQTGRDTWYAGDDGVPVRRIESIEHLFDVAPCTLPAYEGTSLSIRQAGQRVVSAPGPQEAALRRRLQLLAVDLENDQLWMESRGIAIETGWGRRIPAPSWWRPRARIWRHGCLHVLV